MHEHDELAFTRRNDGREIAVKQRELAGEGEGFAAEGVCARERLLKGGHSLSV